MIPILIRPARLGDTPFILASWLNHYKNHSYFAKRIPREVFYSSHEKVVKRIMDKSEATILLAVDPAKDDGPEVLLGFMAYEARDFERPIVHFIYVKQDFRRMGIAASLVIRSDIDITKAVFTHWTYDVDMIIRDHDGMTYNPYKI